MLNHFTRKLAGLASLNDEEIALLDRSADSAHMVPAFKDLIREGDKPGPVLLVLDGWACRYKVLPDGSRQIVAFMMPGDFCDLHVGVLDRMDHSIGTLTACQIVRLPRPRVEALIVATPALTHAFWRSQLVDEGTMRAWIVSIGRRNSMARVVHLMLELYVRMRNVGLTTDHTCRMPLTQAVLADALGLTPVHINRVLRSLREQGIMSLHGGTLLIHDIRAMIRLGGFDESYLHRRIRALAP